MNRRSKRLCAVPGCGNVLSRTNTSGVCLIHRHADGLCRCPDCLGIVGHRRKPHQARPDVRTALVLSTGVTTGNAESFIRVSLPREPWLGGEG